jgi:ketosteroid isomerase-like protein
MHEDVASRGCPLHPVASAEIVLHVRNGAGGRLRLPHSQAAAAALPPELRRAIAIFDRAQVSADTATLADLVTEDYVLVNSDATIDRKAKYLADFLLPGLRMEPYVIEGRIEKAWGDAAVVFGLQRLAWTQDGVRHQRVLRIVHVWTRPPA